jgi:hypothetical protein
VWEPENRKLRLDGRWSLEELSDTTKDYVQLYGFAYSLTPGLPVSRRQEIEYIYGKFPWRGGYSTVNFFNQLFHKIPHQLRPEIQRIQYASPGFIELSMLLSAAVTVAGIVKATCYSINKAHDTYRNIQKASLDHKLSKVNLSQKEIELNRQQMAFCRDASKQLEQVFGLTAEQIALINQRTDGAEAMKMKILLSVFRRVEPLAERQAQGKIDVSVEDEI